MYKWSVLACLLLKQCFNRYFPNNIYNFTRKTVYTTEAKSNLTLYFQ